MNGTYSRQAVRQCYSNARVGGTQVSHEGTYPYAALIGNPAALQMQRRISSFGNVAFVNEVYRKKVAGR